MNFYNKSYAKIFSKNIDNSIYVKQRHFSPFKSYIIANNECKYVFGNQKERESNKYRNIKEIKIIFNSKGKNDKIFSKNYTENEIYEKIKYIQKWWKTIYKTIIFPKKETVCEGNENIKIIYFIKMIYKLLFKRLFICIKENINVKNNKKYYNEVNDNIKKCINKKLKKYETSKKFNKNHKSNNNSLLNKSSTNNHILIKKIESSISTRNGNLKSSCTSNELSYLNSIYDNINKTKNNILNDTDNNFRIKKEETKIPKKKTKKQTVNNISNKEQLEAYNKINNIYNDIKKIYGEKKTIYETSHSTINIFYKKNNKFKLKKNEKNEIMKNKEIRKGKIITNKNNNINVNINVNNQKCFNNNTLNHTINLIKLKKIFSFWKESSDKKLIISKLKRLNKIGSTKNIFKNRITKCKKWKKDSYQTTTTKVNLSNIIERKLHNITPKKINLENTIKQNANIKNYKEKKNKGNNILNNHKNKANNNNSISLNAEKVKKCFSNENIKLKKNKNSNNSKNESITCKYETNKLINLIDDKDKIYSLYKMIKLFEKLNNRKKIRKYFCIWKLLINFDKNFVQGYEIKEKRICLKNVKSPFKMLNNNNSVLKILNKNKNSKNISNSNNFLCQTESNEYFSSTHMRSNSIALNENIIYPCFQDNLLSKDYIYKQNVKSPKIIYKKKFLIDKNIYNTNTIFNEERNLITENNNKDIFLDKLVGLYQNNERRHKINNSIYGRKFLDNSCGNHNGSFRKIEEREICFTPNKKNKFKNNFGINVNITENYLNRGQKNNFENLYGNNENLFK